MSRGKLEHGRQFPGFRALWTDGKSLLGARGYDLYRLTPELREERLGRVPAPLWKRLAARIRILRHGLRLGIHNAWELRDGTILAIISRAIWKLDTATGVFRHVESIRNGNKPGFNGLLVCPDGRIFYSEYSLNLDRTRPSGVYFSNDNGESFRQTYEFLPGDIKHTHFIQWDPFAECLWMGTGDANEESRLLTCVNDGETWEVIGAGSQLWRTIGLVFTPEAVYWGTDAGLDAGKTPNHIVRWDRQARRAETLQEIQGPCHGITQMVDGSILLSTGVERGQNELDGQSHLWWGTGGNFHEIAAWDKDIWPVVVQIGSVHFPHGMERCSKPCLVLQGIKGHGQVTWLPDWPLPQ